MSANSLKTSSNIDFLISPRDYFSDTLTEALSSCKVNTYPIVFNYLVDVLQYYVFTSNLFDEVNGNGKTSRSTLAELFLKAVNSESGKKIELFKKLGDSSLYITGFFKDSFSRKIIDADYYIDMGSNAYKSLASHVKEESFSKAYLEISNSFSDFVSVFSYIAQKSMVQSNNFFDLYSDYLKNGNEQSRTKLVENGLSLNTLKNVPDKKQ